MSYYEKRGTSAVKSVLNAILTFILILAAAAFIAGVVFLIVKNEEKKERIETYHAATVEYKKETNHYIYVKTEKDELIELHVSSYWKDIKVGDTVVYKKIEEYINENNERKLLKVTYEY